MLNKQKRRTDKLCKRLKRRSEKVSESPASKTRRLLQNVPVSGEVQRSLFVHHALMANIKDAFATIKKKKKTQAGNVTDCNWEDP